MKKVFSFLGGALALASAIFMVVAYYNIATGQMPINPSLVDSRVDKMFFGGLMIGCAMAYGSVAPCLWFKLNPMKHIPTGAVLFTGMTLFICGMYYCFIFQSPW